MYDYIEYKKEFKSETISVQLKQIGIELSFRIWLKSLLIIFFKEQ